MRRKLAKIGLVLLNAVVPVFIAACYGTTEIWYCVKGRVVDRITGRGINGIRVSCVVSNGGGDWSLGDGQSAQWTPEPDAGTSDDERCDEPPPEGIIGEGFSQAVDGWFDFGVGGEMPCQSLRFTDVDGFENGAYEERVIWYDEFDGVAELTPIVER